MSIKCKIKKGDIVVVITGKDKGKQGRVLRVLPKDMRVIVSGVNLAVKHTKPSAKSDGGLVQKEMSIHVSNVAFLDQARKMPTKIGIKLSDDGTKVRYSKLSSEVLQ